MKKIKYFMPALAIASVAAAVTPMVTSCKSTSSVSKELKLKEKDKVTSEAKKFKPSTEPAKKEKVLASELVAKYSEAIKANPTIAAEDILYTYAQQAEAAGTEYSDWSIKISNISVGNTISTPSSRNKTYYTLISLDLDSSWTYNTEDEKGEVEKYHVEYRNIPFKMEFNDEGTTPTLSLPTDKGKSKLWHLIYANNWSFNVGYQYIEKDGTTAVNIPTFTINDYQQLSSLKEQDFFKTTFRYFWSGIEIESYYFKNIIQKTE